MSATERRGAERKPTPSLRVELFHPSIGLMVGKGKDISDTGLAVVFENSVLPPVGTIVSIKMKRLTGPINEEAIPMKVVRHEKSLVGLMFMLS